MEFGFPFLPQKYKLPWAKEVRVSKWNLIDTSAALCLLSRGIGIKIPNIWVEFGVTGAGCTLLFFEALLPVAYFSSWHHPVLHISFY